ncbi:MAG TPA: hypothetical protein VFJ65_12045 [Solirubrobacterales bacterium]|nr:hypothetical protein [Solirubrobacterales bacterium]
MRLPASAKWVLLALAGLAIAIGVAVAAANLTSQQIGIASESVSAGDTLAPSLKVPGGEKSHGHGGHQGPEEETSTTTTPEETIPPSEETVVPPAEHGSDDHGGSSPDGDD